MNYKHEIFILTIQKHYGETMSTVWSPQTYLKTKKINWLKWINIKNIIMSNAVEQAVACELVTQRARVRSPVGTSFFGVFPHLSDKCQEALGPKRPRISFGRYYLFVFALSEWMGAWMAYLVFHVRVVSDMAPALKWSLIRGGTPCPRVVKSSLCMWSKVNSLSRQVVTL